MGFGAVPRAAGCGVGAGSRVVGPRTYFPQLRGEDYDILVIQLMFKYVEEHFGGIYCEKRIL